MRAFSCALLLSKAGSVPEDDWGSTSLTIALNQQIARGDSGVFTGGKGILVRNPFDGYSDDSSKTVVPASFWVNDIFAVSQLYPSGDPRKPKNDGDDDAWERPTLALGWVCHAQPHARIRSYSGAIMGLGRVLCL